MAKRYFTAPHMRWSAELETECPDIGMAHTVHEPEPRVIDTGLLDASGNKIMAIDQMDPIGFTRFHSE